MGHRNMKILRGREEGFYQEMKIYILSSFHEERKIQKSEAAGRGVSGRFRKVEVRFRTSPGHPFNRVLRIISQELLTDLKDNRGPKRGTTDIYRSIPAISSPVQSKEYLMPTWS